MDFITREKKFNGARGDIEARQLSKKDKIQLGQQVSLIEDSLITNGGGSNNKNGKMTNGKIENNSSRTSSTDSTDGKSSHCSRLKWILLILMGILLIISAITIAILAFTLFDNEDQCFNQNSPFQQPNYKLFSTKTLYLTAFNYLSKLSSSSQSSVIITNSLNGANTQINSNNLNLNYDKSSIYLPKIFSQQDSLESLNQRLTSPDIGCKVKQLHFFGRHAARLPSSSELERINKHITDVQSRIDLAKYLNLSPTNSNGQQSQQLAQTAQQNVNANGTENKTEICFDPLVQFKQWSKFAAPKQGNQLMETGAKETQAIALRFKSIFPELFDSKLTKIELGTTEELRTAQTALAFIRQIDNFALEFCDLNEFPIENTSDKAKAYEIEQNRCFRTFLKKFVKDKLFFHKKCQQYHENVQISQNFNLKEANRTEFISQSVSKKLKLSKDDQLTSDEVFAIYNACRYESALSGSTSIWCNLFTERDLKFFEFLNDIDDFYNQAYGHPDMHRSACSVTKDMVNSFKLARQDVLSGKLQTEAHFYFTHSEVIQKILAASVDLEHDPEYEPKHVLEHLRRGTTPKERQWQTSLFTPFSANIAFTLYSCPKNSVPSISSEYAQMDVSHPYSMKVVASLNEQPIMLEGCKDYICDLNELLYEGRLNREKKCKLDELCKNNHVFT